MMDAQAVAPANVRPLAASRTYVDEISKAFGDAKLATAARAVADQAFTMLEWFDAEKSKGKTTADLIRMMGVENCRLVDLQVKFRSRADTAAFRPVAHYMKHDMLGDMLKTMAAQIKSIRLVEFEFKILGVGLSFPALVPVMEAKIDNVKGAPEIREPAPDMAIYNDVMAELNAQFSARIAPLDFRDIRREAVVHTTLLRSFPVAARNRIADYFLNRVDSPTL